ncbi:hypothetical protein EI94DRAFT_1704809 [Lactarius quietus]|nr:hypothetical protein EI94DRAFT_1704809 [Lactarius quietus]
MSMLLLLVAWVAHNTGIPGNIPSRDRQKFIARRTWPDDSDDLRIGVNKYAVSLGSVVCKQRSSRWRGELQKVDESEDDSLSVLVTHFLAVTASLITVTVSLIGVAVRSWDHTSHKGSDLSGKLAPDGTTHHTVLDNIPQCNRRHRQNLLRRLWGGSDNTPGIARKTVSNGYDVPPSFISNCTPEDVATNCPQMS